ncbi:preprotein translocase subunit SecG [Devosia sp.]|uniref:preprotein translocase subunit SecG n=1 Tax=Devosia sp. TaxID=1871048 RepID=UPI001B248976|nr:preprotein translocase subunit SecG [Devosia sp.]MBO9588099.1 preprotein translocase subunit SecG [Devosia sp.]
MANVLIVVYLLIVVALIGVILIQRSEGGALGIGGGGGGGLMTARGSANLLTRTTAILATLFFATAIGLTILNEFDRGTSSILDRATTTTEDGAAPSNVLDALNALQGDTTSDLPVPADAQAPATTTPAAPATTPAAPAPTSDLPVPAATPEAAPAATPEASPEATPETPAPATDTQTPATTTGN